MATISKNTRAGILLLMAACALPGHAQSSVASVNDEIELQKDVSFINAKTVDDDRYVVGVAKFKSDIESPYTGLVTEKLVGWLKESNRFIVVDRTHMDRVNEEMEFQKREEFIGRKDLAEQGNNLAAQKIIAGTITKIPVYRMKNGDGSVRGYKASVAFEIKLDDVETSETTHTASFEGKASKECISPEAAVVMAMGTMRDDIMRYFSGAFPIEARILKIDSRDGDNAETVIIKAGAKHGIAKGDMFELVLREKIEGEEVVSTIGTARVMEITGDTTARLKLDKKSGQAVGMNFSDNPRGLKFRQKMK